MEFYSSNYYEAGDLVNPYADTHDHHASLDQGPISYNYSSYEPPTQNFFQYDTTPSQYYHACHNSYTKPLSTITTQMFITRVMIMK
ncbi:hypothetical protein DVH24_017083 [Malus domestica]|uniref:Uncharacterized protein n=1 Tax=Malus domestica TaxID=3750 RepID=A0A498IRZ1_MALDO|nr:hypothetical protein DVH24_017083 [Malus domestica]